MTPSDAYQLIRQNADEILAQRYLCKNKNGEVIETKEEMFWRVANAVAKSEELYNNDVSYWAEKFYEVMSNYDFLPNSPTLMNAGSEMQQMSACFVLPIDDSISSIFETVKYAALIHKSGGGTGFSFSRLRPSGDIVGTTNGVASGPVSFMRVFDAATEAIKQGGRRRGANMAVLRVDHPDIIEFINCKNDKSALNNFNISVALTEDFMRALEANGKYNLINPRNGEIVGEYEASYVFEQIAEAAWRSGEPGIIFIDRINEKHCLKGEIESTNPCGEQPLLPYESCNLGSINLVNMLDDENNINWDKLEYVVRIAVRFLDDVIDSNHFPLDEIRHNTLMNRKIGLGVMGFADMLIKMGISYNSEDAYSIASTVMSFIRRVARAESHQLALSKGCFPSWRDSAWGEENIEMRNATVTTIAPTGTISLIAGVSSGIEPLFAVAYRRRTGDGKEFEIIHPVLIEMLHKAGVYSDSLLKKIVNVGRIGDISEIPLSIRNIFITSHEIPYEDHIKMQAIFQEYTDNAVSKTINLPHSASVEDVKNAYLLAYKMGCKGVTVYRDGSREGQVLITNNVMPADRPLVVEGNTRFVQTGCGKLYVTINKVNNNFFEVFGNMGKAGGCASAQTEAISRLISLALRSGISVEHIIKQLKGISCHMPGWDRENGRICSCADGFARAFELDLNAVVKLDEHIGACPECGGHLSRSEGCVSCQSCGFSKCG